jgi:hypothetical protein
MLGLVSITIDVVVLVAFLCWGFFRCIQPRLLTFLCWVVLIEIEYF